MRNTDYIRAQARVGAEMRASKQALREILDGLGFNEFFQEAYHEVNHFIMGRLNVAKKDNIYILTNPTTRALQKVFQLLFHKIKLLEDENTSLRVELEALQAGATTRKVGAKTHAKG